jgi:hypothetical protein
LTVWSVNVNNFEVFFIFKKKIKINKGPKQNCKLSSYVTGEAIRFKKIAPFANDTNFHIW